MQLLTNKEYNQLQCALWKLRALYAFHRIQNAFGGSDERMSFWFRVRQYCEDKAEYWKSMGGKSRGF